MNLQMLQVISDSLSTNAQVRSNAEAALKAYEVEPQFLLTLISLVAESHDIGIKLASGVYFKNRIQAAWDPSKNQLAEDDKIKIRNGILGVISQNIDILNVRSQLIYSLGVMLQNDLHLGLWPSYVTDIQRELGSDDVVRIHTGLLGLLEFIKVYQWTTQKKRAPLNQAIEHLFPALCVLGTKLLDHLNYKSGEMVKTIAKIFCASIRLELTKSLQQSESLAGWATFFIQVIEKDIPENAQGLPKDLEEREKYPWWKAKKWAFQSLYHLYSRYAWSLKKDKRYSAFSKMFMEFFVPNIVNAYLVQIQRFVSGVWMTDRVKQQIAMFLEECIKPKVTWLMVKPHLESIFMHFIFPILCFTSHDQELWDSDPVEFIHKKIDPPVDDYRSPVTGAEELLTTIAVDRYRQTFLPIMTLINSVLSKYQNSPPESRNPVEKEGVLRVVALLADHLLEDDSPFKEQMESFIYLHVTPEIVSPHGFLRARACDVLLKFGSLEFKENEKVCAAFQSVIQCLKDPELPVRVSAALSITPFLNHGMIHEAMKPHVQTIMHELLTLTNEIDMDTLTSVMEELVSNFSEQIAPFAVQLAAQLRDTFMRIMGEYNVDNDGVDADEVENKTFAAMGVLKTLTSLVMAVESSQTILAELEVVVAPVVFHILKNNMFDLYEETFEMIEMCMFCSKTVSTTIWQLFEVIYHTFKSDGLEFLEEMEPTLDNYIVFGGEVLKQSSELQLRFIDMINTIMTSEVEYVTDSDRLRGCRLMESMMLNLKPAIDNHVTLFLQLALTYLSNEEKIKSSPFRVHILEVIINAIYYNHHLTLSFLESHGATAAFFELWFKNIDDFTRVHDKKLCIVSIITLLQIPQESLPESIKYGWNQFFEVLLKIFENYPEALEERLRQEKIENGEYEDDDDGVVEEEGVSNHLEEHDEDQEEDPAYLEYLNSRDPDGSDKSSDDGSDWSLDLMMEEDIYFSTPLDKLNAYVLFGTLMSQLIATPLFTERIQNGLSPEKRNFIEFLMAKSTQEIKS